MDYVKAFLVGGLFCLLAFVLILFFFVKTVIWGDPVAGFPTLACLILMLSGIELLGIGILGQYLAKNYTESKERPVYIVRERLDSTGKVATPDLESECEGKNE